MISPALKLPRISCTDREQQSMADILHDIDYAKAIVTFYETKKGEFKFLFSDLGESEFALVLMEIHRHVEVFNFFKLVIITIEKMREDFTKSLEIINKSVEYLKLKKRTNNTKS